MKMNEELNWFEDPKNNVTFPLPIIKYENDGMYFITFNKDTEQLLGNLINVCGYGKTEQEAYDMFFVQIRDLINHYHDKMNSYERFVPLIIGQWKHRAGRWFTIFGLNFYFRYGKNMKGGRYIPFTKLNISFNNKWKQYKKTKNV